MDNFENLEWEASPPAFDYSAEMKKIRKSLRKRNFLIVCTCLVLVAALAFGFIQYGIPALEAQYWDPNTSTYVEGIPDLQLAIDVYTELFCPRYCSFPIKTVKTGFATYEISTYFSKWTHNDTVTNSIGPSKSAVISKGELTFSAGFWDYGIDLPFNTNAPVTFGVASAKNNLQKYPSYINVFAAITFPEDLSVYEAYDFYVENDGAIWFGVRTGDRYADPYPACGFAPHGLFYDDYDDSFGRDSSYPFLLQGLSAQSTDVHFLSMLQFLQDQLDQGIGFLPPNCKNENYYNDVLHYVEENGVQVYGAYIICTPQELLDLYDSGSINGMALCDAWINY